MFKPSLLALRFAAALLSSISLHAWAQTGPAAAGSRADPSDAGVPVARAVHQSSFAAYRGFADQEVKDWRESNDNVGRIGGWRAYARESLVAQPAAKKPAAPAPSGDASDAHRQHH